MQSSKTIIAVNADAGTPIFEVADHRVVSAMFTVAPQRQQEITNRRGRVGSA
jgi:electron transfer flavoprotein alpha subunit